MKNAVIKKIILLSSFFSLAGLGWWYYTAQYQRQEDIVIVDYNYDRDAAFIIDMWKKHWYWLVTGGEFSPEYVIEYVLPSPSSFGEPERIIKVMLKNGKHVGYVGYYKKRFYLGYINSLAVDKKYRGKGYGKKMIEYALKDLKKRGVIKVELFTRTTNHAALKIYKGLDFKEVKREDGYVYLERMF